MKFAKIVFWGAGIWGVLTLAPLYFIFDMIGRQDPPAITHPLFYYGFVGVALLGRDWVRGDADLDAALFQHDAGASCFCCARNWSMRKIRRASG